MNHKSILFVCSGNSCRSPMAEYLLKGLLKDNPKVHIFSRGLTVATYSTKDKSYGPSPETVIQVQKLFPNSKVSLHVPKSLSMEDLMKTSPLVLTMESSHKETILGKAIDFGLEERVFTLKEFAGVYSEKDEEPFPKEESDFDLAPQWNGHRRVFYADDYWKKSEGDIQDPIGGIVSTTGENRYEKCREEIMECLERIVQGKSAKYEELLSKIKKRRIKEYKRILDDAEKSSTSVRIKRPFWIQILTGKGAEKDALPVIKKIRAQIAKKGLGVSTESYGDYFSGGRYSQYHGMGGYD